MGVRDAATDDLFSLVYAELRRLAGGYIRRERSGVTLQPTALVHEAYLQLSGGQRPLWTDRGHFMATAAVAMRQVLAQYARRRKAAKRTPGQTPTSVNGDICRAAFWDYEALDQALERLEKEAPELCRVVEARYFAGMSVEETAEHLQVSPRTVKRHWTIARAWLNRELAAGGAPLNPRWVEIDKLFEAALALPVSERDAFILQQAGDERLATEVLTLLRAASEEETAQPPLTVHDLMEALGAVYLDGKLPAHYRVGSLVGEGGMGMVYEAIDERDGAKVAIKILHPERAQDGARLARFQREAAAMKLLDHPGIVRIREAGSCEGIQYLAMEFLEGETLRQRLRRAGPLGPVEVLECGLAISAALDAAHCAGVTHRDLKPENIILTSAGPKVLDFGLAHLNERDSPERTTLEGALSGTVAYLAPEQIEGASGTFQTDIFAFGVVLYEAATGVQPFQKANPIATARAIAGEAPDYARVPSALRPVLQRCLEKDARRRYPSCGLVHADLGRVRAGIRVTANRRVRPAMAACLAAVGCACAWWFYNSAPAGPDARAVAQVQIGRYHLSRRTQAAILKSADCFREAGRIDSKYADAYAWLANSLSLLPEYGINDAGNTEEGRRAARRAIQLNPGLSIAHTALGWILFSHDWNWPEAEREFRKGVERAPNEALPHQRYGLALIARSRFVEAETELKRAQRLEPLSMSPMINLAELWFYARRFDREEAELRVILDRDPESVVARAMLAKVEALTGRSKEAIEEMKRLLALPEGGSWCSELVEIYATAAQPRASLQQAKECGAVPLTAATFLALGQNERAMEALEKSYRAHDENMAFLNVDPSFDPVRGNSDFQRILRRVGF